MVEIIMIIDWLQATLRWSLPLILVSIGEVLSERSGIINMGIEGIMLSGALCGIAISYICAGMVGLAEQMMQEIGVPVIDGIAAGVKVAEALLGCGLYTSKQCAYAPLAEKEYAGMPKYF